MTDVRSPYPVGGYVLAGGKSSRMGRDKALLELRGKALIAHAVTKLERLCAKVAILSANPALAAFAPLVADIHLGCGPLGGIHAALAYSERDWCLILPVDVPFLPSALLDAWVRNTLAQAEADGTRLSMFVIDGRPQPALLMIHRDLMNPIAVSLTHGDYKLLPALTAAAEQLAVERALPVEGVFRRLLWGRNSQPTAVDGDHVGERLACLTDMERADAHLCFANLNTPHEFAEAERQAHALET